MREKSEQKNKSKDLTLFYILLIIGSYAIIFLAILYFGKDYFILLYKNDKQFNVVWDYIYEDKYEEAKVALKEYDTSVPIEARRARITNDFCDICIKYREKEYYDILRFLDVNYTSQNDQLYYDFKDEKKQGYFDSKMCEINQYLEANEGDIYYAHGLLVREETMRRLAEEAQQKKEYEEYLESLKDLPYPEVGMSENDLANTCLGKATNHGWTTLKFVDFYGKETGKQIKGYRYSFELKNERFETVYAYVDKNGEVIYLDIVAPPKYKEKNRYDGLSSKKKQKGKEKDPSDYDVDGYYWDFEDEFYDEDDAWDDFEDNDAWDDY